MVSEIRGGMRRVEIYTLLEVWQRYAQILLSQGGAAGGYDDNKTQFKERIAKHLKEEVDFIPQLNVHEPQLLFPTNCSGLLVQALKKKLDKEREEATDDSLETTNVISDDDRQDMLSFHHAALKIRSEIKSMAPFNNCDKICKKEAESLVLQSLELFLHILFMGIKRG